VRSMKPRDLVAGVAFAALLAVTPVFAQQQGSTSGPAVGTTVAPNAAAEKQNPNQETGGVSPGGALGTGSPGATARSGTQGGPPPEQATGSSGYGSGSRLGSGPRRGSLRVPRP